ncbi:ATP-binding protein [Micrococcus porci]|uniref:DEAD/DEAH box helicase n=1 Tax=Micrococcus porci TaxID=2856555 RepID=UPI001CCF768D|nr:DEAD/DEAH box helicase [Micrococcus porci]UBH25002.1 ATP-binding protein [Micrococcus porci]
MGDTRGRTQQDIVRFWQLQELFDPQPLPKLTPRTSPPFGKRVITWRAEDGDVALPWNRLAPPPPTTKGAAREWRHTLYLRIYALEDAYQTLHSAFPADADAYDERPGGRSAAAGALVDADGRLIGGTGVLSSALWGIGRLCRGEGFDDSLVDGFEAAGEAFVDAADRAAGVPDDDAFGEQPVLTAGMLVALIRLAQHSAGVEGMPALAGHEVRIASQVVSASSGDETPDIDFLNSFYLSDLHRVGEAIARGDVGPALDAYLTPDGDVDTQRRVDVVARPDIVDAGVEPARVPAGRWPAKTSYALARSQQFAVNRALNELGAEPGLMGVNGPPGTGKTTMLRDILAANVVERARKLAGFADPSGAFTGRTLAWTGEGRRHRTVHELRPELTGFEMVVASANNAAVENISEEIPHRDAIKDSGRADADYFADLATAALGLGVENADEDGAPGACDGPAAEQPAAASSGAWGLVAARLGNKVNRARFRDAVLFGGASGGRGARGRGLDTLLKDWAASPSAPAQWTAAREAFHRALHEVDRGLTERRDAAQRTVRTAAAREAVRAAERRLAELSRQRTAKWAGAEAIRRELSAAQAEAGRIRDALDLHRDAKPGFWETITSFGVAGQQWRETYQPLLEAWSTADAGRAALAADTEAAERRLSELEAQIVHLDGECARRRGDLADLEAAVRADEERFGGRHPSAVVDAQTRETTTPWLDEEMEKARTELFLAALELHRAFIAAAARDLRPSFQAAMEVMAGAAPRDLEAEKRRAAWQVFFLLVPLVSTTFASFDRMFTGMGRESLGWLFVDEAGQASPQYAAGAIWRANRAVVVGDPLQLEPVVTIPVTVSRSLAKAHGVSSTWIAPEASVQRLADRVSRYGTTLPQGEDDVWVSSPLRVHRRCDDPMFALSNDLAYGGLMVSGVQRKGPEEDPFERTGDGEIFASSWMDTPARTPGTHLQPNQIERVRRGIEACRRWGIPCTEIIAISPFREVADALRVLSDEFPGLTAGTIHTAQGREADVVFFVLGGAPDKPGARNWASSRVNLANVAVSRAKRRLYVIGDREAWSRHNYFRQIAEALPRAAEPDAGRER